VSNSSMIALGEIMPTRSGSVDPAKHPDEVFDLYSIPAFDVGHPEIIAGRAIGSAKQVVQPGDVLLSRIVPHIRRSWVVSNGSARRTIASGEWIVFRGKHVHPPFLRHVLVGDPFHLEFMRTVSGVGGSLLRARPSYVAQIKIPLPSLAEQQRIAEVLDRAEALRAKRRAALTQLDTLTQSIFLDLFGDPAVNSKNWPIKNIGDLLDSASYGTSSKANGAGDYPILRMNNLTRTGEIDLTDLKYIDIPDTAKGRYLVKAGDVLFNRTNSADLVGKTAIYRGKHPMAYAGYLIRLRTNTENDPEYLSAFLNTSYAKKVLRGMCKSIIGMANINAKEIQAMKVMQTPLPIQREFAKRVAAIEELKVLHRRSLLEMDSCFAVLQQRAFQGEL